MIIPRIALILALVLGLAWGAPNKRATEESDSTVPEEDDYNPQCLPLDFFEKDQSKEIRKKRDETAVEAAAAEPDKQVDDIVAQPGYVVPAAKRRFCWGRRKNFTAGCGPSQNAYRVKNFVMAKNPRERMMERKAARLAHRKGTK